MTVSVQRGEQFRYMTTSVHKKYRLGTSLSRYRYIASCLFMLKVCKWWMDVWSVMLNFLCAVERSFSRSTSNIVHRRLIRERINVNKQTQQIKMYILNQVQVNLIYNANCNLFLWIEIFISTTDLYNTTADRWNKMRRSVCNSHASNGWWSLCVQISRERSYPLPTCWYHSKGNWLRYNFPLTVFI